MSKYFLVLSVLIIPCWTKPSQNNNQLKFDEFDSINEVFSEFPSNEEINNIPSESCDQDQIRFTDIFSSMEMLAFLDTITGKPSIEQQKEVVLILGNTGAGKTTLASFLTDVDLRSLETVEGSGEFVFVDKERLIKRTPTVTSLTEVPNVMIDSKSGTTYYDCPGFSDSRAVTNDISVNHSIQKLIKSVDAVKFVFTVGFSSVQNRFGDRHDFMEFLNHATSIKHIEKYRDAIALVVNKVENRYVETKGRSILMNDEEMITMIAEFLRQTKIYLENKLDKIVSAEEKMSNRKKITFIDILLKRNVANAYERIGILRLADEKGWVNRMPLFQGEKHVIKSIIGNNIQFILCDDSNFTYTISEISKYRGYQILDEEQNYLDAEVTAIGEEIRKFYMQDEENNIFDFLMNNNHSNVDVFSGISKTKTYLADSKNWYSYLDRLHNELSDYDVQSKKQTHSFEMVTNHSIPEGKESSVMDIGLKEFLESIGKEISPVIANVRVNSFKFNALKAIILKTMNDKLFPDCRSEKLVAKGYNVKMSEVLQMKCPIPIKFIEVTALNNLFFDADINETEQDLKLSLTSESKCIIGERKIHFIDGVEIKRDNYSCNCSGPHTLELKIPKIIKPEFNRQSLFSRSSRPRSSRARNSRLSSSRTSNSHPSGSRPRNSHSEFHIPVFHQP